jgi:hypothetical protein
MDAPTIESIRLWMNYTNAKFMSDLSDLYFAESPNEIDSEYRIGQTNHYLDKISCTQLGLVMRMSQSFMAECRKFPTNNDWHSYTKEDYAEFMTSDRALTPPDSPSISSPG